MPSDKPTISQLKALRARAHELGMGEQAFQTLLTDRSFEALMLDRIQVFAADQAQIQSIEVTVTVDYDCDKVALLQGIGCTNLNDLEEKVGSDQIGQKEWTFVICRVTDGDPRWIRHEKWAGYNGYLKADSL